MHRWQLNYMSWLIIITWLYLIMHLVLIVLRKALSFVTAVIKSHIKFPVSCSRPCHDCTTDSQSLEKTLYTIYSMSSSHAKMKLHMPQEFTSFLQLSKTQWPLLEPQLFQSITVKKNGTDSFICKLWKTAPEL